MLAAAGLAAVLLGAVDMVEEDRYCIDALGWGQHV